MPPSSALNLTSNTGAFLRGRSSCAKPRAAQGLPGQFALAVTPNSSWWVSKGPADMRPQGPCWGKPPQHTELMWENLSKYLPLLRLAPPELLAEVRTLLPFNLS